MSATPRNTPQRVVLLATRDPHELRELEVSLYSAGYRVLTARTERETLDKVHTYVADAVLLDRDLTDEHFALCQTLRAEGVSAAAPIMVTQDEAPSRQNRLDALKAGAWDIQGHPPDSEELLLRLGVFLQAKFEIDKLTTDCLIDRASGLYNEHGFTQRAAELAALMNRQHTAAACVVFQAATPLPSPASGDRLGRAFKSAGRQSDAIGRTAAAEFAVFAPATNELNAVRLVNRLRDNVARRGGLPLKAGFSATQATQKAEPTTLLSRARQSLRVL